MSAVYGVIGWKNSGKTGLVERLVENLTGRGLRVSTIKRSHHRAEIDHPGRDTWRHREAGAFEVALASSARVAVMQELRDSPEPSLEEILRRMQPVDLVIAEGFKRGSHPRIEAFREMAGRDPIALSDPGVRAVASDTPLEIDRPVFPLSDTAGIAAFVLRETGLSGENS